MAYMQHQQQKVESSTLIYSLNPDADLTFDQFSLIVRSLHSYKVENIENLPDSKCIIIYLSYNASMKNVRHRLGSVPCTVRKCNPFVKPEELNDVEALRNKYGFGSAVDDEEEQAQWPAKKRRN